MFFLLLLVCFIQSNLIIIGTAAGQLIHLIIIGTAGQRCTTTRRLIVHESLYDDFIARLKKAYSQVEIGGILNSCLSHIYD